jgi:dipicolinate synthase subunit A
MLTGKQIAIIGGDARHLEIIHHFAELDASIRLFGYENLQISTSGTMKSKLVPIALKDIDVVVLPVVGTDDVGEIQTFFSSEKLFLHESHFNVLPKHVRIFTGMAKPFLKNTCEKFNLRLIEWFDRDDVAIYNSIPTAEGAVMMAIQNTDFTIHGSISMVLGLGRTGLTLARTLQGLGSQVKVGVRRAEQYARAWEMGFKPFYIKDLADHVFDLDLLFNTIPTMIVTAHVIANIPQKALIIDLASQPGGTDFRFAEKRGIKALLAPGLPGIVAPKTAGRIIAHTLSGLLQDDFENGRITG